MAREGQRKVLVALDGSESSDHAFEWYLKHLRQPNDYVYGIMVPEYTFSGVTVGPLADPQALSEDFVKQYKVVDKKCSDYAQKLRDNNIAGQVEPVSGDKPGPTIIRMAESNKIDTIVMGTRGLGKFKKFFLGSVSQYVVNHASVPVSVIPLNKDSHHE